MSRVTQTVREIEVAVGDVLQIGDQVITLIDVDCSEVTVRIDRLDADEPILEDFSESVRPAK